MSHLTILYSSPTRLVVCFLQKFLPHFRFCFSHLFDPLFSVFFCFSFFPVFFSFFSKFLRPPSLSSGEKLPLLPYFIHLFCYSFSQSFVPICLAPFLSPYLRLVYCSFLRFYYLGPSYLPIFPSRFLYLLSSIWLYLLSQCSML